MDHGKNFPWMARLWVGRLRELTYGYISKFEGQKVSGSNRLRNFQRDQEDKDKKRQYSLIMAL